MQRVSSQVELDIDGMASWTLSHFFANPTCKSGWLSLYF
jgi:hypothetical protein